MRLLREALRDGWLRAAAGYAVAAGRAQPTSCHLPARSPSCSSRQAPGLFAGIDAGGRLFEVRPLARGLPCVASERLCCPLPKSGQPRAAIFPLLCTHCPSSLPCPLLSRSAGPNSRRSSPRCGPRNTKSTSKRCLLGWRVSLGCLECPGVQGCLRVQGCLLALTKDRATITWRSSADRHSSSLQPPPWRCLCSRAARRWKGRAACAPR